VPLAFLSCTEGPNQTTVDSGQRAEASSERRPAGKSAIFVNEDLLSVIELHFLKGRCLGRLSVDAKSSEARAALIGFAQQVMSPIPLDGSSPLTDAELKKLVPTSNAVAGWAENLSDGVTGPWLITTKAWDWINGAGVPFEDNGFEAAAGESYLKSPEKWKLKLELVNMGSTSGAEAAFAGAKWNEGTPP